MTFTVPANFIDEFKIGDNINYNLKILRLLYRQYAELEGIERWYLIKPIVILNTSIAEALLYDFIENRIRRANRTEKMFVEILDAFLPIRLDKFEHYINQAEKYDFLAQGDTDFYKQMHVLRKKRNRIHIQNNRRALPVDEVELFDEEAKTLSEKVLEKTLATMCVKFPRRAEYHGYVDDFELPWDRHFLES